MPGRGPAPKDPDDRARTNTPDRGEWTTLPPLAEKVLPPLPKGDWHPRTRAIWNAWRADWVTASYGSAEVAMAVELAYVYEDAVQDPKPTRWAEVRQWMDRLGLTMKGKRDLRLRLGAPVEKVQRTTSEFEGLRLVDDAVAS